jgi:cystathionine beta-lyase/cystathionine gamma-synthase
MQSYLTLRGLKTFSIRMNAQIDLRDRLYENLKDELNVSLPLKNSNILVV